jgi:hypothetical protein
LFQSIYNGWLNEPADPQMQRLCKGAVTVCEEMIVFAIYNIAAQAINTPAIAIFDAFF